MKPFNPKPRPCKACEKPFVPTKPMQSVCGPRCAVRKVKQDKAQERAKVRTRKEAIKTIPQLIREADIAFAAWVRERDRLAGHPCISSGRPLDWSGNQTDAGHYRSRGAASHLRYHPDNCHAQSKADNRFLAGNAIAYRIGLIARIGLDAVEALEADNASKKWTHDELREIKAFYKAKTKQLKGKG